MKSRILAFSRLAAIVSVFIVASSSSLHAIPTLRLSDGFTTVEIADGSGLDDSSASGVVMYLGSIGNWALNLTMGTSKPFSGSATDPVLNLYSIDVTSASGGNLSILWSDDSFGPTAGSANALIQGLTIGNVSYNTYADVGNSLFNESAPLTTLGPFGPGVFSATASGALPLTAPFSLTMEAIITHSRHGATLLNARLADPPPLSVPDSGSTVTLLACVLVGLAAFARKSLTSRC